MAKQPRTRAWWRGRPGSFLDTVWTQLTGGFDPDAVLAKVEPQHRAHALDSERLALLRTDRLAPGDVREVVHGDHVFAVACDAGAFYVVDGTCPHEAGPLGQGRIVKNAIVCPLHGWRFDLATGACRTKPEVRVRRYDVELVDGWICVPRSEGSSS